jgi:hypothetical protein
MTSLSTIEKLCIKFLNQFQDRVWLVNYPVGQAGMALIRILNSDSRFIWSDSIANVPNLEENNKNNPLLYPDTTCGFSVTSDITYTQFCNFHLGAAHVDIPRLLLDDVVRGNLDIHDYAKIVRRLIYLLDNNKGILIIPTHINTSFLEKYVPDNIKIINIIGNIRDKDNMLVSSPRVNTTKSHKDNITNVDVGNLFNKDYNTFIDEYIQLCNSLDLEYKGNSVRAFILLWLEKQEILCKLDLKR